MANTFFWTVQSRQRELKLIHGKVAIGASGAPTLDAEASLAVASISRTSAGLYQITLKDKFPGFIGMDVTQLLVTTQDLTFQVKAQDVSSAKTIDLFCKTGATATDPTSGSVLYFTVALKNTSL